MDLALPFSTERLRTAMILAIQAVGMGVYFSSR